jgi:hypothetical protein
VGRVFDRAHLVDEEPVAIAAPRPQFQNRNAENRYSTADMGTASRRRERIVATSESGRGAASAGDGKAALSSLTVVS